MPDEELRLIITAAKGKAIQAIRAVRNAVTSMGRCIASTMGRALKSVFSLRGAFATLAGATGIGLVVKSMIDAAATFEKAFANVETLVDTTGKNMQIIFEDLRIQSVQLSKQVGKPAKELADGLFQVISAGTDASEAMIVLEASANAALAGNTSVFEAVDVITSILNAYGLEASEAGRISDVLFKTVELGKTTMGELANALGTVIPIASQMEVPIEDVAAAVAAMTKVGIDTDTATTSLRAFFTSILKAGPEALEKAEELGLAWDAQSLKARGLVGFLNDVRNATEGDATAITDLIPEIRAATAVMSLAGKGFQDFAEAADETRNALGATDIAVEKQKNTWDFLADQVSATIDTIKIKIGDQFLPIMKDFINNFLLPMLDDMEWWVDINREWIEQNFADAVIAMVDAFDSFDFEGFVEGIKQAFETFKVFVADLQTLVKWVLEAFNAVDEMFNKIDVTIVLLGRRWDGFVNALSNSVGFISSFFGSIGSGIAGFFGGGIPAPGDVFASGTPFVPNTGLAMVHRGEAIIPANQNNQTSFNDNRRITNNFGVGQSNAETEFNMLRASSLRTQLAVQ